jgi:GntR family transcriptional regulator
MYMTQHNAFTLEELRPLDTASFVPLYLQMAHGMAALIHERGKDVVGKALPSESECVNRFRVSRPTVRQAMSHLLSQGLITRVKGRGTFVAPPRLEHDVSHGFEDDMRAAHKRVDYELIDWKRVAAPDDVAEAFKALRGFNCYVVRRLRRVEKEVVGVEERYVPEPIGERLTQRELETEPIIDLLRRNGSDKPVRLDIEVTSVAASRALARLMGVKAGVPLLQRRTTHVSALGQPLMHGTVTFLAEHYQFKLSVNYSC